ncbi:MAG: hypothetical protein KatS3mg108_0338 [Isosphaeraceae bacterium]|jgi:hypothetical protein|nr:MAG: hypothetical protein KatS3mg108_0338 [Isosphaeraceae bacterium]
MAIDCPVPPQAQSPQDDELMAALRAELASALAARPWGLALITVGGIHLVIHLACQALYSSGELRPPFYLLLWLIELIAVLAALHSWLGPGWSRSATLIRLAFRVWITFLILSFNLASLNNLTGYAIDWFKPAWTTLSSFFFMTLAWLCNPWFLAAAVVTYLSGLIMVAFPDWQYATYAVTWCGLLVAIGSYLEGRRRRRLLHPPADWRLDRAN